MHHIDVLPVQVVEIIGLDLFYLDCSSEYCDEVGNSLALLLLMILPARCLFTYFVGMGMHFLTVFCGLFLVTIHLCFIWLVFFILTCFASLFVTVFFRSLFLLAA